MDAPEPIADLIQKVGFPIVVSLYLGYIVDRRLLRIMILLNVLVDRVRGGAGKIPKDQGDEEP